MGIMGGGCRIGKRRWFLEKEVKKEKLACNDLPIFFPFHPVINSPIYKLASNTYKNIMVVMMVVVVVVVVSGGGGGSRLSDIKTVVSS